MKNIYKIPSYILSAASYIPSAIRGIAAAEVLNFVTTNFVARALPCCSKFNAYSYIPFNNTISGYAQYAPVAIPQYAIGFIQKLIASAIIISAIQAASQTSGITEALRGEEDQDYITHITEKLYALTMYVANIKFLEFQTYKASLACAASSAIGYAIYTAAMANSFIILSPAASVVLGIVAAISTAHCLSSYNFYGLNPFKGNSFTANAIVQTAASFGDNFATSLIESVTTFKYEVKLLSNIKNFLDGFLDGFLTTVESREIA